MIRQQVALYEEYSYITDKAELKTVFQYNSGDDADRFKVGNYFPDKEEGKRKLAQFKAILSETTIGV